MAGIGRIELLILGMICLAPVVLLVAGLVVAWALRRERVPCPYCAERIRKDARVCRYCGREIRPADNEPQEPREA